MPNEGNAKDPSPVVLESKRTVLMLPSPDAAPRVVAYFRENRGHLTPWDPPRPEGHDTEAYWRERLERSRNEYADDRAMRLMIFRKGQPDGPVLGVCNFTQFVRGPFQACTLGYSLDHRLEGQGWMSEALRAAIAHLFDALGFHRIMANHLPENARSGRLLRRLGFAVEGYARDYLYVNGEWRDHVLNGLTNPRPKEPRVG